MTCELDIEKAKVFKLSSAAVSANTIGLQQENEPKREHHNNAQKLQPMAAAFLQFAPAQGDHGNSDQETETLQSGLYPIVIEQVYAPNSELLHMTGGSNTWVFHCRVCPCNELVD
jgi:hypothetical protein